MKQGNQKGIIFLLVVIIILLVAAILGGAAYLGKKYSFKATNTPKLSRVLREGGPGGCKGQECGEYCRQNVEECAKWCKENPDICNLFIGGGKKEPPVDPPDTQITFAKSLNMIGDQVTKEDVAAAKDIGANMVTLWYTVQFTDDDKISLFLAKGELTGKINTAHKNGL